MVSPCKQRNWLHSADREEIARLKGASCEKEYWWFGMEDFVGGVERVEWKGNLEIVPVGRDLNPKKRDEVFFLKIELSIPIQAGRSWK